MGCPIRLLTSDFMDFHGISKSGFAFWRIFKNPISLLADFQNTESKILLADFRQQARGRADFICQNAKSLIRRQIPRSESVPYAKSCLKMRI